MFTGIVERTIRIAAVSDGTGFVRLNLAAPADWSDVKLGESIAINGVCLTVAEIAPPMIGFDVIPETLSKTNLGLLKAGDLVNAERSLRAGDRIDGHFVQGHVDGPARLVDQSTGEKEWRLTVHPPLELMKFVVPKGSVTLDGVSLTVAAVSKDRFEVALIPTTLNLTTLGSRPMGWPFNFEADVLSKTIISWLERREEVCR
ncbi:MAG: riboflavin synthase [Phycisphaerales bacterium]|jgi:riboflavin synthase|nr:riboflavin synthase [Phycisphaerales bacterium]